MYFKNKIKLIIDIIENKDIFIALLIIFIATASFGLGRLSKIDENKKSLQIENFIENTALIGDFSPENNNIKGNYVASKTGSKYHLPWCSGAQTIKEENKIWFETKEDAESRGYSPAKNCKGL
jgi:hypothetical protein